MPALVSRMIKTGKDGPGRLSYSKRFDEINSEVTFAGYRFSERNYLTMGEYLDMRYREGYVGNSKELYTIQRPRTLPTCVCQRTSTGRIRLTGTARRPIATACH